MKRRGFANPEYLLTLAAIGIVLAIVLPAVARAREKARNLRALGELRGALARYEAGGTRAAPADLAELAKGGKYLAAIPEVGIAGLHPRSSEVHPLGVTDDSGGWSYSNWPGSPRYGEVWINCTHTDGSGRAWDSY